MLETYGSAELAEMQRWQTVGNALHKIRIRRHIPCFRVVNAKGGINRCICLWRRKCAGTIALEADRIEVIDGKVDLKNIGYNKK